MKKETLCLHGGKTENETGSVATPIYQSATFRHPGFLQSTGYDYSRLQNPTREAAENLLAALEGGSGAIAFSSGMAAISALMELFAPGDHIVASEDLYGGVIRLFRHISEKNGVSITFVDTASLDAVKSAIGPSTKAVFLETPTNPMMRIADVAAIAKLCRARGILSIVDNTFLTPYFLQPLSLGADIVVHSATKYLGGHNDTLAGFLVCKDEKNADRLRFIAKTTGACLSPFDSFLIIRGIKTLAVRMQRAEENAFLLAEFLSKHPKVTAVYYAGLPDFPGHDLLKKQAHGFGAMISFETDTKETARAVLERVSLIAFAESLGGVDSLITYPAYQTHADVPEEERNRRGIHDRLLRLSVGIENVQDLIQDLAYALEGSDDI